MVLPAVEHSNSYALGYNHFARIRTLRKTVQHTLAFPVLKEAEAGVSVSELCRKHSISDATFYTWRKKFGGMARSQLSELKALEKENQRLKKIVADLELDKLILKEAARGNF